MNIIKFAVKRACQRLGVEVRRTTGASSAFLATFADPLVYQYHSDLVVRPIIPIALSDVRAGMMGFGYVPASAHPFAFACTLARDLPAGSAFSAVKETLAAYYSSVQPRSALDVIDLSDGEAPGLREMPVHKWIVPWSELSVDDNARHRQICLEEEGLRNRSLVTVNDGFTLFGPVSKKKLEMESRRLTNLLLSVRDNGFLRNSPEPLEVYGLRVGDRYSWFVTQGQHRFAVGAALGLEKVHARVMRVIRREDARHWPKVVDGNFTEAGAVKFFDRVFSAVAPSCAASWSPIRHLT